MTDNLDFSNLNLKAIELGNEKPRILRLDNNKICKIDKLIFHTQLQQLSIACNELIQINGLNTLCNMTVLNLSGNQIISIDGPDGSGRFYTWVKLGPRNKPVNTLKSKLVTVKVKSSGLKNLVNLTWLSVSNNRIKKVQHLDTNIVLKHLDLSDNLISHMGNLAHLTKLKTLLLHGNEITSLEKFPSFVPVSVEILSLKENCIHDLTHICYLNALINLKQVSLQENPCIGKNGIFDYRPYVLYWCLNLRLIDGEEVSEKEKLITEWLLTQGEIRQYGPGSHQELVIYLSQKCSFTNLKNKSKLHIDLENILEQRRKLSSRRFYEPERTTTSTPRSQTNARTKGPQTSNNTSLLSTDINLHDSLSTQDDTSCMTNNSMLMSESSFLPVSSPNSKCSGCQGDSISQPHRVLSPCFVVASSQVLADVPTIKFSTENPKLSSKASRRNILNSSFDDDDEDNTESSPGSELHSMTSPRHKLNRVAEKGEEEGRRQDKIAGPSTSRGQHRFPLTMQSNNSNTNIPLEWVQRGRESTHGLSNSQMSISDTHNSRGNITNHRDSRYNISSTNNHSNTIINNSNTNSNYTISFTPSSVYSRKAIIAAVKLQSWWRGVRTRSRHPIVSGHLKGRETRRTRAHIIFLQKQMHLYYESYEQQRRLNATQTQAISFLIDQVKGLATWKEQFTQQQKLSSNTTATSEPQDESSSRLIQEEMQYKIDHLEAELQVLHKTVGRLEDTVREQQTGLEFNCQSSEFRANFRVPFLAPGADSDAHEEEASEMRSYSENSELHKVICEVKKFVNDDRTLSCSSSHSDSDHEDQDIQPTHRDEDEDEVVTPPVVNDLVVNSDNNQ